MYLQEKLLKSYIRKVENVPHLTDFNNILFRLPWRETVNSWSIVRNKLFTETFLNTQAWPPRLQLQSGTESLIIISSVRLIFGVGSNRNTAEHVALIRDVFLGVLEPRIGTYAKKACIHLFSHKTSGVSRVKKMWICAPTSWLSYTRCCGSGSIGQT